MSRFPPEIPGGYPAAQSVFCKKHVFSGTDFPNFPKLHKFVPRNFPEFPEFPEFPGVRPTRIQKSPGFLYIYKRLQPENTKKPRIFPRGFRGIFRGFSGNSRDFGKTHILPDRDISGNSGKLNTTTICFITFYQCF